MYLGIMNGVLPPGMADNITQSQSWPIVFLYLLFSRYSLSSLCVMTLQS